MKSYRGRFAPSPSGSLHFGSLVAALASYLDARSHAGEWLVRIEDLDPPREIPGASETILKDLEAFGLTWDGEITYQSQRYPHYLEHLSLLEHRHKLYRCCCTRADIRALGGIYNNRCRDLLTANRKGAVRFRSELPVYQFNDRVFGLYQLEPARAEEDFILKRKDGYYAYQLAVVVDDSLQGITHVVRGADLLESTPKQIALYQEFDRTPPKFAHIPLVVGSDGRKLSKQNLAEPIGSEQKTQWLLKALDFLGQNPDPQLQQASHLDCLNWAIKHWNIETVPARQTGIEH